MTTEIASLPSPHATVVASSRQVACEVGGEAVVLHLDDGMYYGLNQVGALVWDMVQRPRKIEAIVDRVTSEFDVERERCLHDVLELVAALRARRLVIVDEEASP